MEKSPIISGTPGRVRCYAVILSLMMIVVVLAAGCLDFDTQPNRDVGITKLKASGEPDWSVLVTSGRDDIANNIIEYSDGSFILDNYYTVGHSHLIPQPVKISRDGKIEWNQSVNLSDCGSYELILNTNGNATQLFHNGTVCPPISTGDFAENSSGNFSVRGLVKKTDDGGLVLAGIKKESYFLTKDEFVNRRQTEAHETKEYAEKLWKDWCENRALAETDPGDCKSNPIISTIIVKKNPNRSISWQLDLPASSSESMGIVERESGKGYVARFGESIIQVTSDGIVSNMTQLSNISEYQRQPAPQKKSNGESVLLGTAVLQLDSTGRIIGKDTLSPGKINSAWAAIDTPTRDGGLLTVEVNFTSGAKEEPLCFASKYTSDGSLAWTSTVHTPFSLPNLGRVIQTSDGGYVVTSWANNLTTRSP
jgi:hypothetical protein